MKATPQNAYQLFLQNKFKIPLYQRHYAWEEEQCAALWEDFIRLYKEPKSHHYLGTMVVEEMENGDFYIIDGQQRTTTLILLLKALNMQLEDPNEVLIENISERLSPQNWGYDSDSDRFKEVMSDNPKDQNNKYVENLNVFKRCLANECPSPLTPEEIKETFCRMHVAFVELNKNGDDKDDPQIIFEKMNSEGKNLEVHDLIRNYIFMLAAESKDSTDETNISASQKQYILNINEWQNIENTFPHRSLSQMKHFFRDYLIIKTGDHRITSGKELYFKFKDYTKDKYKESLSEFSVIEVIANDIWKHADAWSKVVFGNSITRNTKEASKFRTQLQDFSLISNSTYYPFATVLMIKYGQEPYEKGYVDLVEAFKLLNRFIAISIITGNEPNSKGLLHIINDKNFNIKNNSFKKHLLSLWPENFNQKGELKKHLQGNTEMRSDEFEVIVDLGDSSQTMDRINSEDATIPSKDNQYQESKVAPDFYYGHKRVNLYILLLIDQNIAGEIGDTEVYYSQRQHSLEHIMPQKPDPDNGWGHSLLKPTFHKQYLHSLGNMTLVGRNFNSQISNRPLKEKFEYYDRSSYHITRDLARNLKKDDLIALLSSTTLEKFIEDRIEELTSSATKLLIL
jgi:hypothetical protein